MDNEKERTIMLIDDNKVDHMFYNRIISRSGIFQNIVSFYYADEALKYLRDEKEPIPDLILLDINMPRMDGFEFLEAACRELGEDFAIVIVMLTTSLDPRDAKRAAQYSVVKKYLSKPLKDSDMEMLLALLPD